MVSVLFSAPHTPVPFRLKLHPHPGAIPAPTPPSSRCISDRQALRNCRCSMLFAASLQWFQSCSQPRTPRCHSGLSSTPIPVLFRLQPHPHLGVFPIVKLLEIVDVVCCSLLVFNGFSLVLSPAHPGAIPA